jgi:hypothetical protein
VAADAQEATSDRTPSAQPGPIRAAPLIIADVTLASGYKNFNKIRKIEF